jgi:hypothetical protein
VYQIQARENQHYQGEIEADSCDEVDDVAPISICVAHLDSIYGRANGLAQRQRRDWRDSFPIMAHFWQTAPAHERRSRCLSPFFGGPLEPVLAAAYRPRADGSAPIACS